MWSMSRLVLLGLAALSLFIPSITQAQPGSVEPGAITSQIIERGELICGVNGTLPGFGFLMDDGSYAGFDVEICRAVAAAILGDADAVFYVEVTSAERSVALITGSVDMLSRNTTWTFSRDVEWQATFGPTTFYDGQGVMVRAADGIATLEDLEGGVICSDGGTTTELNISDAMAERNLDFVLQTFSSLDITTEAFYTGSCDAMTSDRSALIAQRALTDDPAAYLILGETLSKEPLGPVSSQSDPQFADIIRWTVWGMINAEAEGITSENIDSFMESTDVNVQRLLGLNDTPAGSHLGLDNSFM
ncbi:MAG: amino acid ABC transporter substrate-binding protein, partial [Chloroflexota bacterium]